jgi:nickel/cobalt transporter (NiCoT) family protein
VTRFERADRLRLAGFGAAVVLLHVAGWALFARGARAHPALGGLGITAYLFGLRHAFDADHIAAIDNTTRRLLADGKRPVGAGFFFSLGHSSVVLVLTVGLALAAQQVGAGLPTLQAYGGAVGLAVSGAFLCTIGILNLLVLADVARALGRGPAGPEEARRLEQRLLERGFLGRVFGGAYRLIDASWKLLPLGALFGLGFDTATEIGLLALAAGVASHAVGFLAVLSLPVLFAAGMSLMDTLDGAFMCRAYGWAFTSPARKAYYNVTVTALSVLVALSVGAVELLQLAASGLGLSGGAWSWLDALNMQTLGYAVAAGFALVWAASVAVWKLGRMEQRLEAARVPPAAGD